MGDYLSPGKILLRLEELKKWQKVQEQRLLEQQMFQRKELEDEHNKLYETIGRTTSYSEYLDSSDNGTCNSFANCNLPKDIENQNMVLQNLSSLMDGVSALNISRESEPILSPVLSSAMLSVSSSESELKSKQNSEIHPNSHTNKDVKRNSSSNKIDRFDESKVVNKLGFQPQNRFNLEEIPIIPKSKDFNTLVKSNVNENVADNILVSKSVKKRPFLKRGQGMGRFNMTKKDIGLKNQSMPWKKPVKRPFTMPQRVPDENVKNFDKFNDIIECKNSPEVVEFHVPHVKINSVKFIENHARSVSESAVESFEDSKSEVEDLDDSKANLTEDLLQLLNSKQSWASVLTQEQEKYIRSLAQSSKYKPCFNQDSDCSTMSSPTLNKVIERKEVAEQKIFEILERKVDESSFSSNCSFVRKIVKDGADTPTLNRRYLQTHPHVLNLKPHLSDLETVKDFNSSEDDNVSKNDEDSDLDHYTDSTESESTCKEVGNNKSGGILTSTPNQSSKIDNKVIKTVIADDTDAQDAKSYLLDDKTITENENLCLMEMSDKTEMLKARLHDLQTEIDIFKRENEAIAKMKTALEEERESFIKEKAEFEKKSNEDKIIAEYYLAEEKEKLLKQKALYDRHVRDMKNQTSKKDRHEMVLLKKEITDLKEQIKVKDAKNGATQARLRNQIKHLEKSMEDLKLENEKLKKENTRLQNANLRSKRLSNIRYLAEINKTLSQTALSNRSDDVEVEDVFPNKSISAEYYESDNHINTKNKHGVKASVVKHVKPFKRTKSAPDLTSHYAKFFSKRDEMERNYNREELGHGLESDSDCEHVSEDFDNEYIQMKKTKLCNRKLRTPDYPEVHYFESKCTPQSDKLDSKINPDTLQMSDDLAQKYYSNDTEKQFLREHNRSTADTYRTKDLNTVIFDPSLKHSSNDLTDTKPLIDHVVIDREDGSKEVRFTNGNTKIILADGSYSKFLYYNGDIKETFYKEGTIKYFYKEVNVHHTTYKDGSQLLQFPDGQIERRYPDGSIESQMADGATRWARAGGVQEWKFSDGTVLIISPQGDRTLRFPNGQIEVHTKEYKRREFPDGTVKIVYADGVVETRFANGRIRVKDKQDRIFLDSANFERFKSSHIS